MARSVDICLYFVAHKRGNHRGKPGGGTFVRRVNSAILELSWFVSRWKPVTRSREETGSPWTFLAEADKESGGAGERKVRPFGCVASTGSQVNGQPIEPMICRTHHPIVVSLHKSSEAGGPRCQPPPHRLASRRHCFSRLPDQTPTSWQGLAPADGIDLQTHSPRSPERGGLGPALVSCGSCGESHSHWEQRAPLSTFWKSGYGESTPMTNLFADLPTRLPKELLTTLLSAEHVRIERIVSHGHASPEG